MGHKKYKSFLFLELRDPEVCSLLNGLRECFNQKKERTNIHLTVRGPYTRPIKESVVRKFTEQFKYDVLKIEGVGRFDNNDEHVVFLRVSSPNLEDIWWKGSYPKSKYGFNPHVSLYRGGDKKKADKIYEFLKVEGVSLLCGEFEFTNYVSSQFTIPENNRKERNKYFPRLVISGKIKHDIFERACSAVDEAV